MHSTIWATTHAELLAVVKLGGSEERLATIVRFNPHWSVSSLPNNMKTNFKITCCNKFINEFSYQCFVMYQISRQISRTLPARELSPLVVRDTERPLPQSF